MDISDSDYAVYIANQKKVGLKTGYRTASKEKHRKWIYKQMQKFKVEGETMLCVGARHDNELEFFDERGYTVEGIDVFDCGRVVDCDMSKLLEHDYFRDQRYDVVFSNDSLEHCIDLDGFVAGLNVVCKRYFVCSCQAGKEEGAFPKLWDAAVHKFMVRPESGVDYKTEAYHKALESDLLEVFDQFRIVTASIHFLAHRFFILEKKSEAQ